MLLLATHDVEAEAFGSLGQLNDTRMRMALGRSERSHGCLGRGCRSQLGRAADIDRLVDVLVHLAHCVEEVTLEYVLQHDQLLRRYLVAYLYIIYVIYYRFLFVTQNTHKLYTLPVVCTYSFSSVRATRWPC